MLNADISFETDVLLAQLTEEFFYKPLTVTHALVLHAFKPRTHSVNHASLLGTYEQSRCPDNLQPPRSSHCSGSTLIEHHFRHREFRAIAAGDHPHWPV